jgi:hypothetical protein
VAPGRWQRIRGRVAPLRLATAARPVEGAPPELAWAGFTATLDARRLGSGTWQLQATARAGGLRRRRARFAVETTAPPATGLHVLDGRALEASATPDGRATLRRPERWATVRSARALDGGERIELAGEAALGGPGTLELVREADGHTVTLPLEVDAARAFTAVVELATLHAAGPPLRDEVAGHVADEAVWDLWATGGSGRRIRVSPSGDAEPGGTLRALPAGGSALVVQPLSARRT